MSNKVKCRYDGLEWELNYCKKCGGDPYINKMTHGERWIDCDCGHSSGLFKNDNNPVVAFKEACKSWNRKNIKRKKR